jgi:hypothetical protein
MQSEIEYNLGVNAAEEGNTVEAFQHYEASIQLDPKNVQGRYCCFNLFSSYSAQ